MTQPDLGITPKEGYFHSSAKLFACAWRLSHTQREQYPVVLSKERKQGKKSSFLWDGSGGWTGALLQHGHAQPSSAGHCCPTQAHTEQEKQLLPGTQPAPAPLEAPQSTSLGHTQGPLLLTQPVVFQLNGWYFQVLLIQ